MITALKKWTKCPMQVHKPIPLTFPTSHAQTHTTYYQLTRVPNNKATKKPTKPKTITMIQWNKGNAPYLNRLDEILAMIKEHNPQILIITEANIHPNTHKPSMNIEGYKQEQDNKHQAGNRSNENAPSDQ